MTSNDWRRTLRALVAELDPGATIDDARRGHIVVTLSTGARVFTSSTPSDWRTAENTRRDLRRALRSTPRHATR